MGRWVNVVAFRHDLGTRPIVNIYWFDTKSEARASHRKAKNQTEREGVVGRVITNWVRPALTSDKVDAQQGWHLQRTNRLAKGEGKWYPSATRRVPLRCGKEVRQGGRLLRKRPVFGVSDPGRP